jgi:hypothetical protein
MLLYRTNLQVSFDGGIDRYYKKKCREQQVERLQRYR